MNPSILTKSKALVLTLAVFSALSVFKSQNAQADVRIDNTIKIMSDLKLSVVTEDSGTSIKINGNKVVRPAGWTITDDHDEYSRKENKVLFNRPSKDGNHLPAVHVGLREKSMTVGEGKSSVQLSVQFDGLESEVSPKPIYTRFEDALKSAINKNDYTYVPAAKYFGGTIVIPTPDNLSVGEKIIKLFNDTADEFTNLEEAAQKEAAQK